RIRHRQPSAGCGGLDRACTWHGHRVSDRPACRQPCASTRGNGIMTVTETKAAVLPTTAVPPRAARRHERARERQRTAGGRGILPTIILIVGAIYCLVPVAWVFVAASKNRSELFSTFTFTPGTGL